MPDFDKLRGIENQLRDQVRETRTRYDAGECSADEYAEALKRFSDHITGPILEGSENIQ